MTMGEDEGGYRSSNRRPRCSSEPAQAIHCHGFQAQRTRSPARRGVVCIASLVILGFVADCRPINEKQSWRMESRAIDQSFSDVAQKAEGAVDLQLVSIEEMVRSLAGSKSAESIAEKLAKGEQGSYLDRLRDRVQSVLADAPKLQLQWRTGRFETLAINPESGDYFNCIASHSDAQLRSLAKGHERQRIVAHAHTRAITHLDGLDFAALSACNITARGAETFTSWVDGPFFKFGERVATTDYVIATVVADSLSYYRRQYRVDFPNRNTVYNPEIGMVGLQIYLIDTSSGNVEWKSGTGAVTNQDGIPFTDGASDTATWSRDVSSTAWYPSCSLFEFQTSTCPAAARPDFYQETRFVYVADSGNCRVRMVDFDSGRVVTRWGEGGCINATTASMEDYRDSAVDSEVVLGSQLSVAWASWFFLIVVDRDANRIRKFVTSQHQGLSVLAGSTSEHACNGTLRDGPGAQATFCRPDAIAVTPDGTRAVVSEDIPGGPRRLRVLECAPTYLAGGDVDDVACTVQTLVHAPVLGSNNLFTSFGGMALTSDGEFLVAGSWDPTEYPYDWFPGLAEARTDYVVVVTLATGAVRAVAAGGALLEGRTVTGVELFMGSVVLTLAAHHRVQTNDFPNIDYFIPQTSVVKVQIDPTAFGSSGCNFTARNDDGQRGLVTLSAQLREHQRSAAGGQAHAAEDGGGEERKGPAPWKLWAEGGKLHPDAPQMVGVEDESGTVRLVRMEEVLRLLA